nr:hypothetical protein CFP56_12469 [Quercus suber]
MRKIELQRVICSRLSKVPELNVNYSSDEVRFLGVRSIVIGSETSILWSTILASSISRPLSLLLSDLFTLGLSRVGFLGLGKIISKGFKEAVLVDPNSELGQVNWEGFGTTLSLMEVSKQLMGLDDEFDATNSVAAPFVGDVAEEFGCGGERISKEGRIDTQNQQKKSVSELLA